MHKLFSWDYLPSSKDSVELIVPCNYWTECVVPQQKAKIWLGQVPLHPHTSAIALLSAAYTHLGEFYIGEEGIYECNGCGCVAMCGIVHKMRDCPSVLLLRDKLLTNVFNICLASVKEDVKIFRVWCGFVLHRLGATYLFQCNHPASLFKGTQKNLHNYGWWPLCVGVSPHEKSIQTLRDFLSTPVIQFAVQICNALC